MYLAIYNRGQLSEADERDLRNRFEECLRIMRHTGDTCCHAEFRLDGKPSAAVVCAVGVGVSGRVVAAIDRLIDKGEKAE